MCVLSGLIPMPSLELRTAKLANTKDRDECVLLIETSRNDETRIFDESGSSTNQRFHVNWVTEDSRVIEHLRRGGVAAVVSGLALPDSHGVETFDKPLEAPPLVPIVIPSEAETEEMAPQAIQCNARNYLVNHHADGCRLRQRYAR
jgi:DNA-binding NtrC family response regulator